MEKHLWVNAGILKDTSAVHELICSDKAYKFLKQVRGSPAYWWQKLYDTQAMMHSIGIPIWFLIMSSAEFNWPKILQAIGIQYGRHFTDEDILNMNWQMKSTYLCSSCDCSKDVSVWS